MLLALYVGNHKVEFGFLIQLFILCFCMDFYGRAFVLHEGYPVTLKHSTCKKGRKGRRNVQFIFF